MAMKILPDICTACGDCEPNCPTDAISPKKGVYAIDPDVCTECEGVSDTPKCMQACTDDCIEPA